MAEFRMSPEELREKAAQLDQMSNRFAELVAHMDQDQKKLSTSAWVSTASQAYSEDYQKYLPSLNGMKEKMDEFSRHFKASADATDQMNQNIVSHFQG